MLASVEPRSMRERLPRKRSTLRTVSRSGELSGKLSAGALAQASFISNRRCDGLIESSAIGPARCARIGHFIFRRDRPASRHAEIFPSGRVRLSSSERKSTFTEARAGIEFTEVPPSIAPKL